MKFAIVGSRDFTNFAFLKHHVNAVEAWWLSERDEHCDEIVSGGARGADTLAKQYAKHNEIPLVEFKADWDSHGKSAGYKRNVKIVDYSDLIIAFWDGHSPGTKHTIDIAKEQGKPVWVFEVDTTEYFKGV